MDKLILIWKYIVYWFKSTNAHGIQSPFVFEQVQKCIILIQEESQGLQNTLHNHQNLDKYFLG